MLRILETNDISNYSAILEKLSIPEYADFHISEAKENDGVKGYIIYSYSPEQVTIYDIDDGHDYNYCDGLVRSVLFKAELKGIEKAIFLVENPEMWKRLALLRFVQNDKNVIENISDIMENCKKCKENPANT